MLLIIKLCQILFEHPTKVPTKVQYGIAWLKYASVSNLNP